MAGRAARVWLPIPGTSRAGTFASLHRAARRGRVDAAFPSTMLLDPNKAAEVPTAAAPHGMVQTNPKA